MGKICLRYLIIEEKKQRGDLYTSSRFFCKTTQTFKEGFNAGFGCRKTKIVVWGSQRQVTHPALGSAHKLGTGLFTVHRHCNYSSSALMLASAELLFHKTLSRFQHFCDLYIPWYSRATFSKEAVTGESLH